MLLKLLGRKEIRTAQLYSYVCQVVLQMMCQFTRAAKTKYHRLGGSNEKFHSSGSQMSETKVLAGLVSSQASFLGSQVTVFFLCLHMVFPLYLSVSRFLIRGILAILDQGLPEWPHSNLIISVKALLPNTLNILRYWGLALQYRNVGEGTQLRNINIP